MFHLRPVGKSLYFGVTCSWNFQDGWAQHLRGAFQRRRPVCFGREDEKGSSWKKGKHFMDVFYLWGGGGGQLYIDIWYNIMANLRYSLWTLDLLSLVGFFSSKCLHHRYLIQWYELSNADDFIPIPQNCGLHQVGRRVLHVYLVFYSATPMTHSTLLYLTGGSRTQRSPRTRQSLCD